MISKRYKVILRSFFKRSFKFWERLGFYITANHFYEPIPDTRKLKDDLWLNKSELIGIDINDKRALELLSLFMSKFKEEYNGLPEYKTSKPYEYYLNNDAFSIVDGEILYCMIRHFKPNKIIEIGSGNTTYLFAKSILKNREEDHSYECEYIVIDPYPDDIVKRFPGLSKLIINNVQNVSQTEFKKLKENDILFIDSTHVLKIGSDVQYLYLEILPRINKGVIIHFHDIFLPAEYPKKWILEDHIFWNEQYLLQAFLTFNKEFEILWPGYYMHLRYPDALAKAFSSYNKRRIGFGSFWMKKVKGNLSSEVE